MREDKRRYFIELQMEGGRPVPRKLEAQIRRVQAEQFVGQISKWLLEQELNDRVASIAITALGQVLITCEQDIIVKIREDENLNIVAVRSGATLTDSIQRIKAV
ncbi:MAG: hypothetical protein WC521_03725 [Bdellovibrionales bacterium]|jgi:hypothetical protein